MSKRSSLTFQATAALQTLYYLGVILLLSYSWAKSFEHNNQIDENISFEKQVGMTETNPNLSGACTFSPQENSDSLDCLLHIRLNKKEAIPLK